MSTNESRDRYAVIGNPIGHSKSPWIHGRFAAQTGEPIEYGHLLAPVDAFVPHVRAFIDAGGRGLNVTVPFKLDAHAFANTLSPRAAAAGAVNTLRIDSRHLRRQHRRIRSRARHRSESRRVVEGRAHSVAGRGRRRARRGSADAGPRAAHVTIVNRTAAKAEALVDQFAQAARDAASS